MCVSVGRGQISEAEATVCQRSPLGTERGGHGGTHFPSHGEASVFQSAVMPALSLQLGTGVRVGEGQRQRGRQGPVKPRRDRNRALACTEDASRRTINSVTSNRLRTETTLSLWMWPTAVPKIPTSLVSCSEDRR